MRLVIRAPNHLGDFIMALPALYAAKPDAVIVPNALTILVELAGFKAIPFDGLIKTSAAIRSQNFDRGILLTPSFSTALLLTLGKVKKRRGTNTDNRGFLLNNKVDAPLLATTHRATVYWLLCTGEMPKEQPIPKLKIPDAPKLDIPDAPKQRIGLFPGSNAPARRWGADRFAALAQHLARDGNQVVVFGGPGEKELTSLVAGDVAIDLGGKTDLRQLAAGLASCDLVISNDSGPLHLAAAVGTRTISMWGAGDPSRTGPPQGHTVIRDRRLHCLECVKNQCPRRGPGYILPEAYMECMQLIAVEDVMASVNA